MADWIHNIPGGVALDIYAVPRASRTQARGEHDGRLKVQIAAPPVDGEANKQLVRFFSRALKVSRSSVTIVSGESGRRKRVEIVGATAQAVLDVFE